MSKHPEVEGILRGLEELTSFPRQDLLLQTLVANFPQLSKMIVGYLKEEDISTIPFWVMTNQKQRDLLQTLSLELGTKEIWRLINAILLLGLEEEIG